MRKVSAPAPAPASKSHKVAPGSSSGAAVASSSSHQQRSFYDHYRILNDGTGESIVGKGKYSVVRTVVRTRSSSSQEELLASTSAENSTSSPASTPGGATPVEDALNWSGTAPNQPRLSSAGSNEGRPVPSGGLLQMVSEMEQSRSSNNGNPSPMVGGVMAAKFIQKTSEGFNPDEGETLRSLNHPHIVPVVDIVSYTSPPGSASDESTTTTISSKQQQVLIMPLVEGGELFELASTPHDVMPESRVAHYLFQLLDAVSHLHSKGIVHRDIKLENVLVSLPPGVTKKGTSPVGNVPGGGSNSTRSSVSEGGNCPVLQTPGSCWGNVQLIDFGFAKKLSEIGERSLNSCCGSPNYMSPEMLRASNQRASNNAAAMSELANAAGGTTTPPSLSPALPSKHGRYGAEVDTWACGVALYVLMFGQYPFFDERRSQWHKKILEGRVAMPPSWRTELDCSPEVMDLISKLLDPNFSSRATAYEALSHPWFDMHGLHVADAHHQTQHGTGVGVQTSHSISSTGYTLPPSAYTQHGDGQLAMTPKPTKKSPRMGQSAVGTSCTPPSAISCTHTSASAQNRREAVLPGGSGAQAAAGGGMMMSTMDLVENQAAGGPGDANGSSGGATPPSMYSIAFTPPRNTHRLGSPSPYAGSKESPF